jgi:hypothetical protein
MRFIVDYPDSPANPHPTQVEAMFKGEPPVKISIDPISLAYADDLLVLRSNSAKLKENQKNIHRLLQDDANIMPGNNQAMQLANCVMNMMRQSAGCAPPELPIRFFNGPGAGASSSNQRAQLHFGQACGIRTQGSMPNLLQLAEDVQQPAGSDRLAITGEQQQLAFPNLSADRGCFQVSHPRARMAPRQSHQHHRSSAQQTKLQDS